LDTTKNHLTQQKENYESKEEKSSSKIILNYKVSDARK